MTSERLTVEKPSAREMFERFKTFKKIDDDDREQICRRKFNLCFAS